MKIIYISLILFSNFLIAKQTGIERLMEGNKRYVNDNLKHPNQNAMRRESVNSKQNPFAVIVGCSDSRVPPEIIFDQGIGDLFVVRVAGNVVGPLELDSIEYSALYLGSTVVLVMGHENCGAVDAVINGTTKDIEAVAQLIMPSVREERKVKAPNLLKRSIKQNAVNMRNYLRKTHMLGNLFEKKKIAIEAAYYDFDTGKVKIIN